MRNSVTCRQVSPDHPDRMCDQLADAVVTECLRQDRDACADISCTGDGGSMMISGTVSEGCRPDYEALVERVYGGRPGSLMLMVDTVEKPKKGVWAERCGGAVYGYATNETPELLPLPLALATRFIRDLMEYRGTMSWALRGGAEAQVTVDSWRNELRFFQYAVDSELCEDVLRSLVDPIMQRAAAAYSLTTGKSETRGYPLPRKRLSGISGHQISCDTYGGAGRMGGGVLSGYSPNHLARAGSYMARKIARDIVLDGIADTCEVQLAYGAGGGTPLTVNVECHESERQPKVFILEYIRSQYDLTPEGIISFLKLRDMDYTLTDVYGHFGNPVFPWEQ